MANNSLECVQLLLKRGAEVNARNDLGFTALAFGSTSGHPELVRFWLNQKAHIHVHDKNGDTPLHLSTTRGQVEVAQPLIGNGADVNAQNDEGSAPLHRASEVASNGNPDVVRLLLDRSVDVEVRKINGKTTFEVALDGGKQEIVNCSPRGGRMNEMGDIFHVRFVVPCE